MAGKCRGGSSSAGRDRHAPPARRNMGEPCQAAGRVQDKGEGDEIRSFGKGGIETRRRQARRRLRRAAGGNRREAGAQAALRYACAGRPAARRYTPHERRGSRVEHRPSRVAARRGRQNRRSRRARTGYERGVLSVYAASAVWVQELSLLSEEIVERLRRAGYELTAIRFRVKSSARAPSRPVRPNAPPPAPLPDELRERLKQVDDPALRAVIAEAAARSLALPDPPAAKHQKTPPAQTAISAPPGAPNLRSAGPKSDRLDQDATGRRAGWRRSRGGRAD